MFLKNFWNFLHQRYYTYFASFIPRSIILFYSTVNGYCLVIFKVFIPSLSISCSDNMLCLFLILEQLLTPATKIQVNFYK